ncbi:MAG: sigma-70 family RNA polymerase sigma factor [Acidobacteria bacterium]|nr:sigma-70 family RNA polymerase sigma factor [Acidobacteriota bacterium]
MEIESLYRRYGPMVMRRCRYLLRDEAEAEDVTQEVFVQLLRHRGRWVATYPSSLLYRIATNLCLNRIRSRNRRKEEHMTPRLLTQIAAWRDMDAGLVLGALFDRHRTSTRIMAVMHYLDGMTHEQIAAEFNMSVSGIRKRLRKLRESLHALEAS